MSMKNSNDNIGNRTRDVPACSAVPQPTSPPRAPVVRVTSIKCRERVQMFVVSSSRNFPCAVNSYNSVDQ